MQVIRTFTLEELHEITVRPYLIAPGNQYRTHDVELTHWYQPWNSEGIWDECIERGCYIWLTSTPYKGIYVHNDVLFALTQRDATYTHEAACELIRKELLAAHMYGEEG